MQETIEKTREEVQRLAAVNEILERNNYDQSRLIPILQQVQEVFKYLPKDAITYVATSLDLPVAHVYLCGRRQFRHQSLPSSFQERREIAPLHGCSQMP